MTVFAAVSLFVAVAPAAAANCSNPLFLNSGILGAPTLPLIDGPPVKFPTGAGYPCQAFEGDLACCTNETLQEIQKLFDAGDEILTRTADLIQNNNYSSYIENLITSELNLVCNSINKNLFPSLKTICDQASNTISSYVDEISTSTKSLVEAELSCVQGLSNYYKGVLCFACDSEWEQYLIKDPVSAIVVALNISNSTCSNLDHICAPVNQYIIEIADYTVKLANDLLDLFTGGLWPTFNFDVQDLIKDVPDACGGTLGSPGDCETYICEQVVNGVNIPAQSNWGQEGLSKVFAADNNGNIKKSSRQLSTSVAGNVYSPNGYNAYGVGEQDVSNLFPGWAVALVVIASVLVLVAVVAGIMMNSRNNNMHMAGIYIGRSALTSGHQDPTSPGLRDYGTRQGEH